MRRLTVGLAVTMGLVLSGIALPTAAEAKVWSVAKPNYSVDPLVKLNEYENRVMVKINKIRAKKHLPKVKYFQSCLDRKSEKWAGHLADIGSLVHRDQQSMLKACNLNWTGETLVSGTALAPGDAVKAWMHSKPHRQVIMKKRAARAGVGSRITAAGKIYTVLNFGDPS
jgi:uncharacterized protein YkwD